MAETLPPVGATVTDGFGLMWTREEQTDGPNEQPEPGWWRPCSFGHRCAVGDKDADLTSLWRLQQERDQQANRAEEAEAAWTEEKQANITLKAENARLREALGTTEDVLRGVPTLRDAHKSLAQRVHDAANVCAAALASNREAR